MALGGHNVKSVKDHKDKGNYRPSRHGARAETKVTLSKQVPNPPKNYDKRHADLWRTVCKEMHDMGVLADVDIRVVEQYVDNFILWQEATKDVQEQGFMITVETQKGVTQVKNPAIAVMNDAFKVTMNIADKCGFHPRARMGIKTEPQEEKDPFADFINN